MVTGRDKRISEEVIKAFRKAVSDIQDVFVGHLFDSEKFAQAIDDYMTEWLDDESTCGYLSFDDGEPNLVIGLGPGDCAAHIRLRVSTDGYDPDSQIAAIDALIKKLNKVRKELVEKREYEGEIFGKRNS